ncbi:glycosyltransferase family 4 protein [Deminuibacter soli]|uniref:Glycosyltransferase n=1 Tax=Deminuibacter soli TaxID=2291815 RepID=A0A3E1NQJ5_9BACT|nr:glycosyltransferase family 4 protein [Deminuibacter soli]RFM30177.1 glycosyltransferase [Deminuibacter soli]
MEDQQRRIQIAYISISDPQDKRSWSGITYYVGKTLQKNVGDVDFLGPVTVPPFIDKMLRAMSKFSRAVFGRRYLAQNSLLVAWYAARVLERKLQQKKYDFIFAPASSVALGMLKTKVPVIYMSDATWKLISNYEYNEYKNLVPWSSWESNYLEKKALKKSTMLLMTSQWAAQSVVNDYKIPVSKVYVASMGANMDSVPAYDVIFKKEENKELTMLFLAVDWKRKGGDLALSALRILHDTYGIKARLIVCGCEPPEGVSHPYMEVIPFLNKNLPEHHAKFVELLSTIHFLLIPTRADCSLLVGCEANAYGVPVITTETGGVPGIVHDGINGYCVPYSAEGWMYATLIAELFADKEKYHNLVLSSRERYEEELNWDKWSENVKELYQAFFDVEHPEQASVQDAVPVIREPAQLNNLHD